MTLFSFDPFEPLVSQLARTAAFLPATDVAVDDGDLVVTMDVPGLAEGDLSIELQDGYLVIRGERTLPQVAENVSLTHHERAFGAFERRIKVPDGVDSDAIKASLDNGVLWLTVPKPERMKAKAITIDSGAETRHLEATAS